MDNKLKDKLTWLAAKCLHSDTPHFSPYDASGGNSDDAYSLGIDDGEILLARSLLREFFGEGENK